MAHLLDRILSRPHPVFWAGFRSDTYQMQQAGWKLAVESDVCSDRIRLAARHDQWRLYAISEMAMCRFTGLAYADPSAVREEFVEPFVFKWLAPGFEVMRIMDKLDAFEAIDAQPMWDSREIRSIEDFKIFAPAHTRTEEIIVEPADVQQLLDRIKEMQAPGQAALRAKQRLQASREGYELGAGPKQQFHAQILSISDYREAA